MKVCESCGALNEADARFCTQCAKELQVSDLSTVLTPEIMEKALAGVQKARKENSMGRGVKIALWGPSSCGKTTYVVSIYEASLDSDWIVTADPDSKDSENFISITMDKLNGLDDKGEVSGPGKFPIATEPGKKPKYYDYYFAPGKKSNESSNSNVIDAFTDWLFADPDPTDNAEDIGLVVSFADVAGEDYLTAEPNSELWDHLAQSKGLICLIDPAEANSSFKITRKLLDTLWKKLRKEKSPPLIQENKLPHYIAFCFTKMDQREFYPFLDKPEVLMSERAGKTEKLIFKRVLKERIKFFGISSIGVDPETQESLVDETDNTIPCPAKIQPINVLEPLEWLFHELNL